ncbi:MAG: hypothetical protein R2771_07625 [Saprospiraceae bacterium]
MEQRAELLQMLLEHTTIEAAATDVLKFSYLGFLTKEVTVGTQTKIDVTMDLRMKIY